MSKSDIALKLLSFGPNGVNIIQVSFFLSIVSLLLFLFCILYSILFVVSISILTIGREGEMV